MKTKDLFVPKKKKEMLESQGWKLTYDSFTRDENNRKIYPDGRNGMQKWILDLDNNLYSLYIHYDHEGKHYCKLYEGLGGDADNFSLLRLEYNLKKFGLWKEGV